MDVFYILFIISICALQFSECVENEPVCSKFPFAEQTLERMLRVEAKVDQWDKEMRRLEETSLSVLEHRKEKTDKQLQKMRDEIEQVQDGTTTVATIIAFNAYTTVKGEYAHNQTLIFPDVLLNEGGGYDPATGNFTAPVAGLYHFTAQVCNQHAEAMVITIMHGEDRLAISTTYEDKYSSCSSTSAPVIMEVGESVYIKTLHNDNYLQFDAYRRPAFMGVLVQGRL
ncbi:heavy metal-binding protein HIP-like [Mercenaria mercenaria]|uniref:heavy metal-binding protein HIP-like n=1 Tax=Mercenaria mercenaria TaxID=6596 RepID=UPI00234F6AF3|nr:heavy metal-binding protein HIP-like [Mercenaria mercenaria]